MSNVTMPGHWNGSFAKSPVLLPTRSGEAHGPVRLSASAEPQQAGRRRCRNTAIVSLALAVTCLMPRYFGFVIPLVELASLPAFYLALRLSVGAIRPGSLLDQLRPRGVGRVVRRGG